MREEFDGLELEVSLASNLSRAGPHPHDGERDGPG